MSKTKQKEETLVKKSKIRYMIPVGLFLVILCIGCLLLAYTLVPEPNFKIVSGESIDFKGKSGQTIINTTQVAINPNGQKIDAILVEGVLYEKIWNESKGDYDLISLSEEKYSNLFLKVKNTKSLVSNSIGYFTNKSIYLNVPKTSLLPIKGDLLMEFIFEYHFPDTTCSCQSINCHYVFQPSISFGYEV